ncbi:hypothetical protein GZ78_00065 [Endozoicomonas numazuensis]|uniref:Uncharacterized protein n=1 Tax=Endozoicomonas numazuensis TaxID=1137799 RepID=A0A081NJF6_9GAMM|nr:hypothetical protein GZ78_00065 [Endozoicomonas numazuensis]
MVAWQKANSSFSTINNHYRRSPSAISLPCESGSITEGYSGENIKGFSSAKKLSLLKAALAYGLLARSFAPTLNCLR